MVALSRKGVGSYRMARQQASPVVTNTNGEKMSSPYMAHGKIFIGHSPKARTSSTPAMLSSGNRYSPKI
jgi:hypothetical protein